MSEAESSPDGANLKDNDEGLCQWKFCAQLADEDNRHGLCEKHLVIYLDEQGTIAAKLWKLWGRPKDWSYEVPLYGGATA